MCGELVSIPTDWTIRRLPQNNIAAIMRCTYSYFNFLLKKIQLRVTLYIYTHNQFFKINTRILLRLDHLFTKQILYINIQDYSISFFNKDLFHYQLYDRQESYFLKYRIRPCYHLSTSTGKACAMATPCPLAQTYSPPIAITANMALLKLRVVLLRFTTSNLQPLRVTSRGIKYRAQGLPVIPLPEIRWLTITLGVVEKGSGKLKNTVVSVSPPLKPETEIGPTVKGIVFNCVLL